MARGAMRLLFRLFAAIVLLAILGTAAVVADLWFDQGRIVAKLLGRDALVAACQPALEQKLRASGFDPADITLADDLSVSLASGVGRTLSGDFTFEDGAARSRVDGVMACVVRGEAVSVEVRTRSTPLRAT